MLQAHVYMRYQFRLNNFLFTWNTQKWNSLRVFFYYGHLDRNEISFRVIKCYINTTPRSSHRRYSFKNLFLISQNLWENTSVGVSFWIKSQTLLKEDFEKGVFLSNFSFRPQRTVKNIPRFPHQRPSEIFFWMMRSTYVTYFVYLHYIPAWNYSTNYNLVYCNSMISDIEKILI